MTTPTAHRYDEALRLMKEKAEERQPRAIEVRITFLRKAKASAEEAAGGVAAAVGGAVLGMLGREKLDELDVMIKEADMQERIYKKLSSQLDVADLPHEVWELGHEAKCHVRAKGRGA